MSRRSTLALASALLLGGAGAAFAAPVPRLNGQTIDRASRPASSDKRSPVPDPGLVKAAVLLDRARLSPGAIDGLAGDNLHDAIKAYQQQAGLDPSGLLDPATWDRLTAKAPPTVKAYLITPEDAKGPFTTSIPTDFEAQSRLKHLGYHNVREELSERFHMAEPLLRSLNPGSAFRAGDRIVVADVARPSRPERPHASWSTSRDMTSKRSTSMARCWPAIRRRSAARTSPRRPAISRFTRSSGTRTTPTTQLQVQRGQDQRTVHDPARAQQSRRPGVDGPRGRRLRHPRHARPGGSRKDAVARLHSHDELGCPRPRVHGGQEHGGSFRRRAGLHRSRAPGSGHAGPHAGRDPDGCGTTSGATRRRRVGCGDRTGSTGRQGQALIAGSRAGRAASAF